MQGAPDPWFTAKLDAMSDAMANVQIMELQSNNFAPHYRKGNLIFVKPETAQPTDHVFLKRNAADSVFGVLVHRDAKAIYVRGFKTGDRLQSVPLSSISEWGRIAMNWRAWLSETTPASRKGWAGRGFRICLVIFGTRGQPV